MAYLVRLVALLVLVALHGSAFAFPATANYRVIGCVPEGRYPSVAAAGAACMADRTAAYTAMYEPTGGSLEVYTNSFKITYTPASMGNAEYSVTNDYWSCPSGATLSGATCGCNSGLTENNGSCTAPTVNNQQNCSDAAVAGSAAFGQSRITARLASGTSLCIANENNAAGVGCRVDLLDVSVTVQPNGDRYVQGFPRRTNTGADTCPVAPPSDPAPKTEQSVKDAPKACPGGQQASMNGVVVCQPFPSGSSTTTPTKSTTTTSTGTGIDGNSPTASSASGQTQCVADQCTTTTTTTTTKADGTTSTSTSTTTQSKGGFCSENPASPQCGEGSFSGACGSSPVCTGDAVQCAVAAFTLETKCALTVEPKNDAQIKLFNDSIADQDRTRGEDGSQTDIITSHNVLTSSDFDRTELLGAPVDLPDQTYSIQDLTFVIPWSKLNAPLKVLGLIGQAVVFLLCARIVLRG